MAKCRMLQSKSVSVPTRPRSRDLCREVNRLRTYPVVHTISWTFWRNFRTDLSRKRSNLATLSDTPPRLVVEHIAAGDNGIVRRKALSPSAGRSANTPNSDSDLEHVDEFATSIATSVAVRASQGGL